MYNVQNCDITNKLIKTASALGIPTVIRLVLNETKKNANEFSIVNDILLLLRLKVLRFNAHIHDKSV